MIPLPRIIIAGGPRTGKTTLAKQIGDRLGTVPWSTDDVMDEGWSESSLKVSTWFDRPAPWIIEGVAAARAIRKWLAAHPTGKPCDYYIFLTDPKVSTTPGQDTMAKGCLTVWNQIKPELARRGVEIVNDPNFFAEPASVRAH